MKDLLIIPWFIFWTVFIYQFELMEPFKHKTISGQEIVQSRDEVIQNLNAEKAEVVQAETKASQIRNAYSAAQKNCSDRSYDGSTGKSAGESYDYANYVFNTSMKACYVTKMSGVVDGDYTYALEVAYIVDLPDISLVYEK